MTSLDAESRRHFVLAVSPEELNSSFGPITVYSEIIRG